MRVPIPMPKLGYDMTSGFVVSWLVSVGDEVVIEMESSKAGTLVEIVCEADEDTEIEVGEVIGYLEEIEKK